MRRFRNPAYATEFLERKLSPSGFTGLSVPAEVSTLDSSGSSVSSDASAPAPSVVGPGGTNPPNPPGGTEPLPTGPDGAPPVIPTTDPNNPSTPG